MVKLAQAQSIDPFVQRYNPNLNLCLKNSSLTRYLLKHTIHHHINWQEIICVILVLDWRDSIWSVILY